ncbi:dihydrolipoamide acetyltransferase family protein [Tenggerimyces flavus]|uniref:Dihydrolipoamide acetyltransferase component of pyruvate dehydrogenase complex n=1 Tax=Tenggerimyces flavus TaxID=1708749 RepID=A0ABV7YPT2_9ACTN|nr:dihydrolipoamide acetyltransferase family protein [Tenggerimyces flavus]MBM7784216.1 pyruvate dehydrogenase E2 component (dihydrolipoamide acetyltransferase) [Tenggerimyces flavus]
MSEVREFKLPDVGEGLVEAEIVTWKVKPGDTVAVNDIIVEVETAKALVELPSPWAGTVTDLLVEEGQTVPVGTPIFRVGDESVPPPQSPEEFVPTPPAPKTEADQERHAVLVGYGPRATSAKRRARTTDAPAPVAAAPTAPAVPVATSGPVLAKPPVRKLAKDLGVDLRVVTPSGPNGTISREDVQSHVAPPAAAAAVVAAPIPIAAGERETRVPIRGVRKMTAQAVTQSAFTAPHVTEWITTDATATMELVAKLKQHRDFRDLKVSPLVVLAKACLIALRRTQELNSVWDEAAQEIIFKQYVNLGIAAATPRGLVVPNIKDADRLSMSELARALGELTATAREGKTQPAEMAGTTFTITNVGVFGIDGGTPILNPGESGIIAFGAIKKQPWVVDDEVVPRWVTTLSLSFDHRLVDGEQGSRFLADVASIMSDPSNALLLA